MIEANSTLSETRIDPFMNTPSSRRQFVKNPRCSPVLL